MVTHIMVGGIPLSLTAGLDWSLQQEIEPTDPRTAERLRDGIAICSFLKLLRAEQPESESVSLALGYGGEVK